MAENLKTRERNFQLVEMALNRRHNGVEGTNDAGKQTNANAGGVP